MSPYRTVFVFPAFSGDYEGHPAAGLRGFERLFRDRLLQAAEAEDDVLAAFDFKTNTFAGDPLRTQFLTYVYSIAAAGLLRENGWRPTFNAGYSMGLYAALADAGSIDFPTGLTMIRLAYKALLEAAGDTAYGMGSVIGLDHDDLVNLIRQKDLRAEIVNQNADHSFVVAGTQTEVVTLLALAREEGALNTRLMDVAIPYHAGCMQDAAGRFSKAADALDVAAPTIPVVSLVDQSLITTARAVKSELHRNLFHPLNWMVTMKTLSDLGTERFLEVGNSKGLARNARFTGTGHQFHSLDALPSLV